ncbi:hypothetical protein BKA63DRAFT_422155 [Paraphoma chrysanthemicola]|nr:hypothetical protein BKA63DRAFT_422155 [Paraphoma chrysanthemicola]
MSNIRDLFARNDVKEKVPPDLRQALRLLNLNGFEDLEERFLSTDAFLRPWSVFRDSLLLHAKDAIPRPTQISMAGGLEVPGGITRMELLWLYTHYDKGNLRYDPRADRISPEYTPDTSLYGIIDKSSWGVVEYEKHLYAWLLQEWKVGKKHNPWGFEYFELRSVCSAWQDVFIPVVNAVRASYNPQGRRYYGRLALYVETQAPSRLAFPDSNVAIPEGGALSPTPYRVVSVPKRMSEGGKPSISPQYYTHGHDVLGRKQYDEAEKELREVYPQYGGLVERPKFKHKMEEWLAEQRVRADRRKVHEQHGEVQIRQPQVVQRTVSRNPSVQTPQRSHGSLRLDRGDHRRSTSQQEGGQSPIKKFADGVKRSFTQTVAAMKSKEEPKSPLHGVTRQLHFPEPSSTRVAVEPAPQPRPEQYRKPSEMSVYTSIRNSNPFTEDSPEYLKIQRTRTNTEDSDFSPMAQLSAIPRPLMPDSEDDRDSPSVDETHVIRQIKSFHETRFPSYEGTGYRSEISLTNLHNQRLEATRSPPSRSKTPATRLPAPITPIPYGGTRIASADKEGNSSAKFPAPVRPIVASPPKPVGTGNQPDMAPQKSVYWPGMMESDPKSDTSIEPFPSVPKATKWPGFESDDEDSPPPIPLKSPERSPRARAPGKASHARSRHVVGSEDDHDMLRIVSKENIRAKLDHVPRESSAESLVPPQAFVESARIASPMRHHLQPYNTHMFPRKDERKD